MTAGWATRRAQSTQFCTPSQLVVAARADATPDGGFVTFTRFAPSLSVMAISTLPLWRHRSVVMVGRQAALDAKGERLGCGLEDLG